MELLFYPFVLSRAWMTDDSMLSPTIVATTKDADVEYIPPWEFGQLMGGN